MDIRIDWTLAARRVADTTRIDAGVLAAALGVWVQVGDVIECPGTGGAVAFAVAGRRVVLAPGAGEPTLWLRLDHPAHGPSGR